VARRSGQGFLFGEPPARGRRATRGAGEVGPAAVDPALAAVAADLPAGVRLGTSSWSFPGWRGIVWDREASAAVLSRRGLAAYARHPLLRAVGVDRTFYAPVGAEVLAGYAAQVPEDFRFVVKAPAAVTSPYLLGGAPGRREANPGWLDVAVATDAAVRPFVEGLGARGGALVFQFPPLGRAVRAADEFAERLARFLRGLPPGPCYAVEIRDRDLLGETYRQALASAGATHAISVHPRMPDPARQRAFADPARPLVVRWMLHAGLDYEDARERYAPFDRLVDEDPTTRETLAETIAEAVEGAREALVIANNKAEGSAPLTVFRLGARVVARLSGSGSAGA